MTEKDQKLIEECDIVVWYKIDDTSMNSKYIRANTKSKRSKNKLMGPKYNILLFKEDVDTPEDAVVFSAIIGDIMGYVERVGNIGYSGLVFRENSLKITKARKTIVDLLDMFGFIQSDIKKVLKSSV